jgi:regulatory LuxR family protein
VDLKGLRFCLPRRDGRGAIANAGPLLLVLVRGESNQEIAEALDISAKTVGHHVQQIYQKADVRERWVQTTAPRSCGAVTRPSTRPT